jgi:hypothetical protein
LNRRTFLRGLGGAVVGYSDLTTDFVGGLGAIAGAAIHSPGEYTALKAGA